MDTATLVCVGYPRVILTGQIFPCPTTFMSMAQLKMDLFHTYAMPHIDTTITLNFFLL